MSSSKPDQKSDDSSQMIFGPGGLIAAMHDQYEFREGQIKMAEAIATATRFFIKPISCAH